MASKGALPLLFLGAAALFMMSKKKSSGNVVDGMKLHGDCQGLTTVDMGDWMNAWIAFWKVNGFEGKVNTVEDLENAYAKRLQEMFPQCTWPPADTFKLNETPWPEGMELLFRMGQAAKEAQEEAAEEAAGEPADAAPLDGNAIGRASGGY